jgi:spoIIIJ-associated protein
VTADQLTVEATGETVGEAKWAALRELEQRYPGLDKAAVRFEVISEGQRGLLGVGYAPARVVAALPAEAAGHAQEAVAAAGPRAGESELAADVRGLVERIAAGIGVHCRVDAHEGADTVRLVCSGPDLGLLIGRHGQTIDAIQYLVNAIVWRTYADDRKEVVVDAAGYRERRRESLEALAVRSAEQALRDGEAVELEPMTAVERKVVHLRLKEFDGVETSSEGTEPNRYVVISPAQRD